MSPTIQGGKSGTNPAREAQPLLTREKEASQIRALHNEKCPPGVPDAKQKFPEEAKTHTNNDPGSPAHARAHGTTTERMRGNEEYGGPRRVPGSPTRAPAPGRPGSAPRGNRLGATAGKLRAGWARGGALLTHAVLLLSLGGDPARHGGAGRSPLEPPLPPPLLGQETLRLGRHLPFLPRRDRMGRKKFAAEAVSCGTGRAERRGPDGKGRERRREAGRRPTAARPGARALGPARGVPRGTQAAVPSPRTPARCTHRATHILYFLMNTVHLANTNLRPTVLTLDPPLCTASTTLYQVPQALL